MSWAGRKAPSSSKIEQSGSFCILQVPHWPFLCLTKRSSLKKAFLQQLITLKYLALIVSGSKLDTTNLSSFHFLNVNYLIHEKLLGPIYKTA